MFEDDDFDLEIIQIDLYDNKSKSLDSFTYDVDDGSLD